MKKNIIQILNERMLISQISNKNKLDKILQKKINIYCGFDPTYKSLHLGHLIPLITMKRFKKLGHNIYILIGETTAIIGDPSYKKKERISLSNKKIIFYVKKIKKQIKKILKIKDNSILNNKKWLNKINIIFFLKNIGIHFTINQIMNKEAIKKRIKKNQKHVTFSEISYNILQSYDFLYLYKKYNIKLQIGGSDQWGNITSGINLINKKIKKETFGITLPLMVKNNGEKFGKTENKTLWLDKNLTSPYKFYQFWLNIPDNQVEIFLKQLTFIKIKKIKYIIKNNNFIKSKQILAQKITKIVHGEKEYKKALHITNIFFLNIKKNKNITQKNLKFLSKQNISKIKTKKNISLKNALVLLKITKTKTQSFNLIVNNAISVNNKIINNPNYKFKKQDKLYFKYTIIKKSKKTFSLIIWV